MIAPDLYRVNGSLPIPNHTTQRIAGSIGGDARGDREGFISGDLQLEDGLRMG